MLDIRQRFMRGAKRFDNLRRARANPLTFFLDAASKGPITPVSVGPFDTMAVSDGALIESILQRRDIFVKDTRGQRVLRELLGTGLVTIDGPEWKDRRRIAQPAFRRPRLAVYANEMVVQVDRLVDRWADGETIDLGRAMMGLTLDIAVRCLFADDLGGQTERIDAAMGDLLDSYLLLLTQPLPNPERIPFGPAATYRKAIAVIDEVVADLIARRRAAGTDGDDLLHLWLASDLDDRAIRDEVLTMLLAAHETTANTLIWALVHLGRVPFAARRLAAEAEGLDIATTALDAGQMPWTDAVVRETLRTHPVVWMLARKAAVDTELGGVPIPKGTAVSMQIYAMQHDAAHWPRPEGFDPERWLDPETCSGPWLPFGAGGRKCIGSHFAMLEGRLILGRLAQRVDLALTPGTTGEMSATITLRPAEPIHVVVRRLDH